MDNITAKNLIEFHGIDFQKHCLRHNILIESDEQGSFVMPNSNVLTQCILASDRIKWNVNKTLKRAQKCVLTAKFSDYKSKILQKIHKQYKLNGNDITSVSHKKYKLNGKDIVSESHKQYKLNRKDIVSGSHKQYKLHEKKQIKLNKNDEKIETCLTDSQLHVYLYGTSPILPTYKSSVKHILSTDENGNQLYEFIIKRTIPELTVINYKVCSPLISPLLEQFKEQHNSFHYSHILKQVTHKQEPNKNTKHKYEVTKKQLKLFFNLVFGKVVPLKIFGKIRNLKKVKKTLFDLMHAPHFKSFSLKPLIHQLDIISITWLKDIESDEQKLYLLAKFTKWFFIEFLLKILYIHFHITLMATTNNERLYIARFTWKKIQNNFIRKSIHSYGLQPDVKCKGWKPPIGIYKLIPKNPDVRPIFMPQYKKNDKNHLLIIFQFLKQLHITEYGSSDFQQQWKSIVKRKHNSRTKQFYFVCCDVANAFGSIKLNKLYEIIKTFCKKLPDELKLRYCVVKSKVFKDDIICYKQYICDPNLKLPLAPGTLYAYPNHGYSQWVTKNWLLRKISKYILNQRVKIKKKSYIIGKGIAQGTMLSPILSDIYYNFMLHEVMATFFQSGKIIKYMDDILYVTEDEISAKQFLQLVDEGIPQYNCFFRKLKTQTNVAYNGNMTVDNIVYIGYNINCNTLEVKPKDSNTDIRYIISFTGKNELGPLDILKQRLNNIAPLRLSKFILDRRLNSQETIIKILEEKFVVQAKRACVLIKELFTNIKENVRSIHNVLTSSNARLARYVLKALTFRRKMKTLYICKWNINLLVMLWKSYKDVFKEDKILKRYFAHIIKAFTYKRN